MMISIRFLSFALIGVVISVGVVGTTPGHIDIHSAPHQIGADQNDEALDPLPATFGEQASQGLSAILAGN